MADADGYGLGEQKTAGNVNTDTNTRSQGNIRAATADSRLATDEDLLGLSDAEALDLHDRLLNDSGLDGISFFFEPTTDPDVAREDIIQANEEAGLPGLSVRRVAGGVTNSILFGGLGFTQALDAAAPPPAQLVQTLTGSGGEPVIRTDLGYVVSVEGDSGNVAVEANRPVTAPTILNRSSGIGGPVVLVPSNESDSQGFVTPGARFQKFGHVLVQTDDIQFNLGGPFPTSYYGLFQTGFNQVPGANFLDTILRGPDNFVAIQASPGLVTGLLKDTLSQTAVDFFGDESAQNLGTPYGALDNDFDPITLEPIAFALSPTATPDEVEAFAADLNEMVLDFATNDPVDAQTIEDFVEPGSLDRALAVLNQPFLVEAPDPTRSEAFLFAAGDVDGDYQPSFSVDHYFLSPGLLADGVEAALEGGDPGGTISAGIRAFLREESAFANRDGGNDVDPIPLADSGVFVVNRAAAGVETVGFQAADRFGVVQATSNSLIAQLAHADFGMVGEGSGQRSTISVTTGVVGRYQVPGEQAFDIDVDAHTFGSTRDSFDNRPDPASNQAPASVLLKTPLFATAAGGGNPQLPGAGRLGYLVLENFTAPSDTDPGTRGRELPLRADGTATEAKDFALLRLATGVSSSMPTGRSGTPLGGHAAGLFEFQNGEAIGVALADGFDGQDVVANLALDPDPVRNQVSGTLNLAGANEAAFGNTITLGAAAGDSAFIDDQRFAATSTFGDTATGEFALVSADLVASDDGAGNRVIRGLTDSETFDGDPPLDPNLPAPDLVVEPDPLLRWGFFFGDRIWNQGDDPEAMALAEREHVHLGTWVASTVLDHEENWSGTATYRGQAIGEVYDNGVIATKTGKWATEWTFAGSASRGEATLKFDGGRYEGDLGLKDLDGSAPGRTRGFGGNLAEVGGTRDRVGRADGDFLGVTQDYDAGGSVAQQPYGVGGQFQLQSQNLDQDAYLAKGTFVGRNQNPVAAAAAPAQASSKAELRAAKRAAKAERKAAKAALKAERRAAKQAAKAERRAAKEARAVARAGE